MQKKYKYIDSTAKETIILTSITVFCAFVALAFIPDMKPEVKFSENFSTNVHVTAVDMDIADVDKIAIDELLDFSPIFVTTRWNYSHRLIPPKGDTLPLSGSDEHFGNAGKDLMTKFFNEVEQCETGKNRQNLLNPNLKTVFTSIGRKPPAEPISQKNGIIRLVSLKSGTTVKRASIPADIPKLMRSIAEFSVSISPDGWVNKPLVRESSGNEIADAKLASFLHSSKLLDRLDPGNYKAIFIP